MSLRCSPCRVRCAIPRVVHCMCDAIVVQFDALAARCPVKSQAFAASRQLAMCRPASSCAMQYPRVDMSYVATRTLTCPSGLTSTR
eukprot:2820900-Rhodomonas_salina.2